MAIMNSKHWEDLSNSERFLITDSLKKNIDPPIFRFADLLEGPPIYSPDGGNGSVRYTVGVDPASETAPFIYAPYIPRVITDSSEFANYYNDSSASIHATWSIDTEAASFDRDFGNEWVASAAENITREIDRDIINTLIERVDENVCMRYSTPHNRDTLQNSNILSSLQDREDL